MKNTIIWIVAVVVVAAGGYFAYRYYFSKKPATEADKAQQAQGADQVQGQDVTIGTGEEAKPGTIVTVDYVGKLADGTVFDSSVGKEPLVFTLGEPGIIPGFQVGVNGMKVGGERLLAIPPELGYGDQEIGIIPPNSTLIFAVKLVKVEQAPATSSDTSSPAAR